MANVLTEYNNVTAVYNTQWFNRNSIAGKSPSTISALTNTSHNASVTSTAVLGNEALYQNLAYAGGYLDFNRDPRYFDSKKPAKTQRQTKMHAINSWLHGQANNHTGPNGGVNNLFWGSASTNGTHIETGEHDAKSVLRLIKTNTTGGGFITMYGRNPDIKLTGSTVLMKGGANANQTQSTQQSDFAAENIERVDRSLWDRHTAFALEYTTNVTYHSAANLNARFRDINSISYPHSPTISNSPIKAIARGVAIDQAGNANSQGQIGTYFSIGITAQSAGNQAGYIAAALAGFTYDALVLLFKEYSVLESTADLQDILHEIPQANLDDIFDALYDDVNSADPVAAALIDQTDKTDAGVVNSFTPDDIAVELIDNWAAELETALRAITLVNLRTYAQNADATSVLDAFGDVLAAYVKSPNANTTTDNIAQQDLGLLFASNPAYNNRATAAANEMADMCLKTFRSTGLAYVPEPDAGAWTKFRSLNTAKLTDVAGFNLDNMPLINEPAPKVGYRTNKAF
jgi:hypothetical protein